MRILYSSTKPSFTSGRTILELPSTTMSLPGFRFSFAATSWGDRLTTLELFHSAFFSVLENTIFGDALNLLEMNCSLSFAVGQYAAISSQVTRPNRVVPADRRISRDHSRDSSSKRNQSISFFGPAKYPSRERILSTTTRRMAAHQCCRLLSRKEPDFPSLELFIRRNISVDWPPYTGSAMSCY